MRIARGADAVWAVVGALERQHEWFPTESTRMEGSTRWVTLRSGLTFEEEIVTHDHALRRYQYRIVGNPGISHHLSTVDVLDDGDGGCTVVYSIDMVPDVLAMVIGGAAGEGLETLRRRLEHAEGGR